MHEQLTETSRRMLAQASRVSLVPCASVPGYGWRIWLDTWELGSGYLSGEAGPVVLPSRAAAHALLWRLRLLQRQEAQRARRGDFGADDQGLQLALAQEGGLRSAAQRALRSEFRLRYVPIGEGDGGPGWLEFIDADSGARAIGEDDEGPPFFRDIFEALDFVRDSKRPGGEP